MTLPWVLVKYNSPGSSSPKLKILGPLAQGLIVRLLGRAEF
jgi:hypothetical protein